VSLRQSHVKIDRALSELKKYVDKTTETGPICHPTLYLSCHGSVLIARFVLRFCGDTHTPTTTELVLKRTNPLAVERALFVLRGSVLLSNCVSRFCDTHTTTTAELIPKNTPSLAGRDLSVLFCLTLS